MKSEVSPKPVCRPLDGEILEVPWGVIGWSASRKLGNSTTMTFGRAVIHAGKQNARHRHPNCDEILHLLGGRLEHTLGDERFVLEAGDTISIPQGIWHQATALGAQDAEMIICFSSADRITELDDEEQRPPGLV